MEIRKRKSVWAEEEVVSPSKMKPKPPESQTESASISPLDLTKAIRLDSTFYDQPCVDLAKGLLGKVIVRTISASNESFSSQTTQAQCSTGDGKVSLACRIVETEAYLGAEDKAAHTYKGRKTNRNEAMFMTPGTAYVYNIYGMYQCFNVSSKGEGAAVLVRGSEPLLGLDWMKEARKPRKKGAEDPKLKTESKHTKPIKTKDLCNGPSKLCQAMAINKPLDRHDLCTKTDESFYLVDTGLSISEENIVTKPRIGIGNYAEEWTHKPLRFYIANNEFVSVK